MIYIFMVQITIINYDHNTFVVQATVIITVYQWENDNKKYWRSSISGFGQDGSP